jgi:hypothetical protein
MAQAKALANRQVLSVPLSLALICSILVIVGIVEFAMGRSPICSCGYVKLWHGNVKSSENSQHFSDWYSFSHISHGIIFFWILAYFAPTVSFQGRAVIAIAIEALWEVVENSNYVIELYRAQTISFDYFGDTIVNSIGDILFTAFGFLFAARMPTALSVGYLIGSELLLAGIIRDNLFLNILMLLHPLDAIKTWQSAG